MSGEWPSPFPSTHSLSPLGNPSLVLPVKAGPLGTLALPKEGFPSIGLGSARLCKAFHVLNWVPRKNSSACSLVGSTGTPGGGAGGEGLGKLSATSQLPHGRLTVPLTGKL